MVGIYQIKEILNNGIRKYSDDEVEKLFNAMICLAAIECEIRKKDTFVYNDENILPAQLQELTIERTKKWFQN